MFNSLNTLKITTSVIIILIIGLIFWFTQNNTSLPPTINNDLEENSDSDPINNTPPATRQKYQNGIYSAIGNYVSPAGPEEVLVSLTITNDTITAANFEVQATHPTSQTMQNLFKDGFSEFVMGRPLSDLNLSVVNGSSLTPKGFNDAVAKIQAEARL